MKINNLVTVPANGKTGNQFVGIKIKNNIIEFHYPETYKLAETDQGLRKDILTVLRTISLAKTMTKDKSSYYSQHNNIYTFPLAAYLWILNDYLIYGRYENREKVFCRGANGKINWKRTLSTQPVISDGNVIYTDIISEKKSQTDNLITQIYNFCVKKASDDIGWLYGFTYDTNGIDYKKLFNKKLYISTINTELSKTYDDVKKYRLNTMKNIIIGLDDGLIDTDEVLYGIDSYDYVFERMIDSMFSNIEDIKSFYPNATWKLILENESVKSSNLRPDTVMIVDKKVFIIDAKYYRYGITFSPNDMPETTSIQKQITYGEYVKKVKEKEYKEVYSAFLLPYSKTENKYSQFFHENFSFVGIGEASWVDLNVADHRKVAAILIDMNYLIAHWSSAREDEIKIVAEIIEENIKGGVNFD